MTNAVRFCLSRQDLDAGSLPRGQRLQETISVVAMKMESEVYPRAVVRVEVLRHEVGVGKLLKGFGEKGDDELAFCHKRMNRRIPATLDKTTKSTSAGFSANGVVLPWRKWLLAISYSFCREESVSLAMDCRLRASLMTSPKVAAGMPKTSFDTDSRASKMFLHNDTPDRQIWIGLA